MKTTVSVRDLSSLIEEYGQVLHELPEGVSVNDDVSIRDSEAVVHEFQIGDQHILIPVGAAARDAGESFEDTAAAVALGVQERVNGLIESSDENPDAAILVYTANDSDAEIATAAGVVNGVRAVTVEPNEPVTGAAYAQMLERFVGKGGTLRPGGEVATVVEDRSLGDVPNDLLLSVTEVDPTGSGRVPSLKEMGLDMAANLMLREVNAWLEAGQMPRGAFVDDAQIDANGDSWAVAGHLSLRRESEFTLESPWEQRQALEEVRAHHIQQPDTEGFVNENGCIGAPFPEEIPTLEGVHVVKFSDTLWEIAQEVGTTVEALKRYDNLESDFIELSQRLGVPSADTRSDVLHPRDAGQRCRGLAQGLGLGNEQFASSRGTDLGWYMKSLPAIYCLSLRALSHEPAREGELYV